MKTSPQQIINKVGKIFKTLKHDQKAPITELVKAFQSMLEEKYYSDIIEILLVHRMYAEMMSAEVFEGKEIPLHQIGERINTDLKYGKKLKKAQLISVLKSHELANKLEVGGEFNTEFADWDAMIEKTLKEMKVAIYWTKSQKQF